ncbi:hypothetical protein LTR72_011302 [Exophiala xenobiotica]|nr:hypothetical protein LTR72_011302 [Exophiala xenobiotica]KAK5469171.1 hypothetical protein LTR55_011294 [Exophiala xenobiotica]
MTIDTRDKKIAQLELEIEWLEMDQPKDRPRTRVAMPNLDAMRHTKSPLFTNSSTRKERSNDDDMESFSNVGRTKSERSTPASRMDMSSYVDRPTNTAPFSVSTRAAFKTNSATANRGYDNKITLRDTVFASMIVACTRKYMAHRRRVPDLYHRIKYADLPAVQSKAFSKRNPTDVPESSAKDWWDMSQDTDGAAAMAVIESIFRAAKMKHAQGTDFSIAAKTKINMSSSGIESFCRCLKKAPLKKYVNYRLQGDDEATTMLKIQQTIRDTDIFDSKNIHKGTLTDLFRELMTSLIKDTLMNLV